MRPARCRPGGRATSWVIATMLTPKVSQVTAATAHPIKPKRK